MNIYLKHNQLQILSKLQQQKRLIEAEYAKVVERENEIVTVIVEAHDCVIPKEGVRIEDNVIIVPDPIAPFEKLIDELTAPKTE